MLNRKQRNLDCSESAVQLYLLFHCRVQDTLTRNVFYINEEFIVHVCRGIIYERKYGVGSFGSIRSRPARRLLEDEHAL